MAAASDKAVASSKTGSEDDPVNVDIHINLSYSEHVLNEAAGGARRVAKPDVLDNLTAHARETLDIMDSYKDALEKLRTHSADILGRFEFPLDDYDTVTVWQKICQVSLLNDPNRTTWVFNVGGDDNKDCPIRFIPGTDIWDKGAAEFLLLMFPVMFGERRMEKQKGEELVICMRVTELRKTDGSALFVQDKWGDWTRKTNKAASIWMPQPKLTQGQDLSKAKSVCNLKRSALKELTLQSVWKDIHYQGQSLMQYYQAEVDKLQGPQVKAIMGVDEVNNNFFKSLGQAEDWFKVCDQAVAHHDDVMEETTAGNDLNKDYCKNRYTNGFEGQKDKWPVHAIFCGADYVIRRAAVLQIFDENMDTIVAAGAKKKEAKMREVQTTHLKQWRQNRMTSPRFTIREREMVPASSVLRRALQIKFLLSFGLHRFGNYPMTVKKLKTITHRPVFPQFEPDDDKRGNRYRGRNEGWAEAKTFRNPGLDKKKFAKQEEEFRKWIVWPTEKEVHDDIRENIDEGRSRGHKAKACSSEDLQKDEAACEKAFCLYITGKQFSRCVDKPRVPMQVNADQEIGATVFIGWRHPQDYKPGKYTKGSGVTVPDNGCYKAFGDDIDGEKFAGLKA